MKYFKLRKGFSLKFLLVIIFFISGTSFLISQNYTNSDEDIILKEASNQNLLFNEQDDFFKYRFKSYLFLGITTSELSIDNSLRRGITFTGIFLIINIAIVIKKYNKSSRSDVREEESNYGLNNNLSEQEIHILNLVQEYLAKNRYFEIDKIIPHLSARLSKSELSLNKNGIEITIANLIKKNMLVDGSKFIRDEILKNPNRFMIYNLILNKPGIHFMKIISLLGMSIFLVKWHLNMLLKFDYIKKTKMENRELYYDSRYSEKKARFLHFMGRERTLKIIYYLKKKPNGSSKYRISKDLKMHPNTVTKYIQKLEDLDILSRKKLSNKTLYILKDPSLFLVRVTTQ
ncbi:MAG: hypothetical protein ACFFCE_08345 [Promethearchaeota archaeon]